MSNIPDSSYEHADYSGKRVLILAPHQDDETLESAALTMRLTGGGADVFVVYATNGDWKYPADIRYKEAVRAAKILGVEESRIVFLGYGDSYNNDCHDHLFYAAEGVNPSSSGHSYTYGANGRDEYCFEKSGEHHAYNNRNYLRDLIGVIGEIRPDMIVSVDLDEHPDHRMLALYTDMAIGLIRREDPSFAPLVWKRPAYALAYTAKADYDVVNNPSTLRPREGETEKYLFDLVDHSIYQWDARVRIPVNEQMQKLHGGPIADALRAHASQHVITRADRILNSDEVYWERRTDSAGCSAAVTASSGDPSCLNDNMLLNMADVDARVPVFKNYCWRPDEGDQEKKAKFEWADPVDLEQIRIYGAVEEDSRITALGITLSDGFTVETEPLPSSGAPLTLDIGSHSSVRWCEIRILGCSGTKYGISECEFFESAGYRTVVRPFAKITVGDQFVYEYLVGGEKTRIGIGRYSYGETGPLKLSVAEGRAVLKEGKYLYFPREEQRAVLELCNESGDVWDRVVIRRCSDREMKRLRERGEAEKLYLKMKRAQKKFSNMAFIMKTQGPKAVAQRTWNNVIRPAARRKGQFSRNAS